MKNKKENPVSSWIRENRITPKSVIYWFLALLICSFGIAICTKANLGLSMIAAPAYIISKAVPLDWYTQGTSEYIWEAFLILLLCLIVRRFRVSYILSFGTAVIAGKGIDLAVWILNSTSPYTVFWQQLLALLIGDFITAFGVAFFFRTTMPLQVYELAVNEIADRFGFQKRIVKYCLDGTMLLISLVLSGAMILFGMNDSPVGIGVGTVITTVVNAPLITFTGKFINYFESPAKRAEYKERIRRLFRR